MAGPQAKGGKRQRPLAKWGVGGGVGGWAGDTRCTARGACLAGCGCGPSRTTGKLLPMQVQPLAPSPPPPKKHARTWWKPQRRNVV